MGVLTNRIRLRNRAYMSARDMSAIRKMVDILPN